MTKNKPLKVSDQKRIDPTNNIPNKKKKIQRPPHWAIHPYGIYPSKLLRESQDWRFELSKTFTNIKCYEMTAEYMSIDRLVKENKLDEALEIYVKYHPQTKNWAVRFVNIQPLDTKREVIF
jgi:hypothetical protein